jgi:hypothetical protein
MDLAELDAGGMDGVEGLAAGRAALDYLSSYNFSKKNRLSFSRLTGKPRHAYPTLPRMDIRRNRSGYLSHQSHGLVPDRNPVPSLV